MGGTGEPVSPLSFRGFRLHMTWTQPPGRELTHHVSFLQLIVGEDLTKSLMALCTDLEASCAVLVSDIVRTMDLHPDDPTSHQVKAALRKFQQTTSLKVTLPLMELEAAREDMEAFMWSHLQELSSQTESQELIGELSQKLADHTSMVRELVQGTHRGRSVPMSTNRTSGPSASQG